MRSNTEEKAGAEVAQEIRMGKTEEEEGREARREEEERRKGGRWKLGKAILLF